MRNGHPQSPPRRDVHSLSINSPGHAYIALSVVVFFLRIGLRKEQEGEGGGARLRRRGVLPSVGVRRVVAVASRRVLRFWGTARVRSCNYAPQPIKRIISIRSFYRPFRCGFCAWIWFSWHHVSCCVLWALRTGQRLMSPEMDRYYTLDSQSLRRATWHTGLRFRSSPALTLAGSF